MKYYLAGPMSGLPESNYALFNQEAARLRAEGHDVVNPAENPEPPCGSWVGYMRMSVAQVVTCEAVAMLPGWENSKGATLERHIARALGMQLVYLGAAK